MLFKRKFVFDKALGRTVEITSEGTKPICDELSKEAGQRRVTLATKSRTRAKWPRESMAMAVNPEDIKAAREYAAKRGVSVDYTRTGEPILTSLEHQRRYCRAMGYYDRSGYDSPRNR